MGDDGQPVEITALNDNIAFITSSVKNSLPWFANNLVTKRFIARQTSQDILGRMGVAASDHVSKLMDEVYTKIENVDNKREWFDKFVAIFCWDAAYEELVERFRQRRRWCVASHNQTPFVILIVTQLFGLTLLSVFTRIYEVIDLPGVAI